MAKKSYKSLKSQAPINKLREIFPRTKDFNKKPNSYQLKKLKSVGIIPTENKKRGKKSHAKKIPQKFQNQIVLQPDESGLDFFYRAGFEKFEKYILTSADKFRIHTLYFSEDASAFYAATFKYGAAYVQLIPTFYLPTFLQEQMLIDEEEGKWYDSISIREGDRDMWGGVFGFEFSSLDAEKLLKILDSYKRHGALIGEGSTFDYIQVCYIKNF